MFTRCNSEVQEVVPERRDGELLFQVASSSERFGVSFTLTTTRNPRGGRVRCLARHIRHRRWRDRTWRNR